MVDPVKTIGIDLWAGQARGGHNHPTVMRSAPRLVRDMHALFVGAYNRFAQPCREVDEPGLAIVAIDEATGRAAGLVRLRARVARYVAGIIGRHDECDLFLNGSSELALRHLVVILDPVKNWGPNAKEIRYRVLDLRTEGGFADEDGRHLRGLRAEGPAFLRVAGYALFMLPLGDVTDWPEDPDEAWAMLPERVYFDELQHVPEGSMPRMRPMPSARSRTSMIMRTQGPRDTGIGLVTGGDESGTLELIGKHQRGTITIGRDALRSGVLLGRYARCDGAALMDDASMSRVHALLIDVDDALLLIDTASRNGTRLSGEHRARVITIGCDSELRFGSHTRGRWRWFD